MDVHTYLCLSLLIVMGVFGDEVKSVSVLEGQNVTLHTDTQLHGEDEIRLWWSFGPGKTPQNLAKIDRKDKRIKLPDDSIFQNRVKMNDQTGDLTITNITSQHSGLYTLMISRNKKVSYKKSNLTVYAGLPVPDISRNSSQCSSSSSSSCCCVLCSVMNVSHDVSVSWYKGKSLLSSISVSDLNIRLSLPLEVEYQDTNTYRCVLNNPVSNQTQHLNITQLCHMCEARLPAPDNTRDPTDSPTLRVMIIPVVFALVICVIFIIIIIRVYMHKRKHYKAALIKTSDGEVPQTDEESSIDSSSTSDGGVL